MINKDIGLTNKLFFLPIEPIEERYSIQWLEWFKQAFNSLNLEEGINYEIIDPPNLMTNLGHNSNLPSSQPEGQVLNIYNTNYYKSAQMCELATLFHQGKIQDGDSIFLMDAWNPIIEQLEYIRLISGIKFKICGMLHAGCWDKHDFVNRYRFQSKLLHLAEKSWLTSLDKIFVASNFHKGLITSFHQDIYTAIADKIIKVPFPFNIDYIADANTSANEQEKQNNVIEKQNIIVFPHRLDNEKHPEIFLDFAEHFNLKSKYANKFTFIRSKDICKTKNDFYELLAKSKISISFSSQETFGIAMLESVAHGCIPIVPNALSYAEMYPACFQYNKLQNSNATKEEYKYSMLINQIDNLLDNYNMYQQILPSIIAPYKQGCANILLEAYCINNDANSI